MSPFRLVATDPFPDRYQALFTSQLPGPDVTFACPRSEDPAELAALLEDADVILTRWRGIDRRVLEQAGRARLVQVLGRYPLGVDLAAARAAGVAVATMPHRGAIAVAEQALALMLAVARQAVTGDTGTRAARYRTLGLSPVATSETVIAFNWLKLPVTELYGRTLGLVGFGEIGREVARRAGAFDMHVQYYQRRRLAPSDERMTGGTFARLDDLLASSDYVSLHVPHTPETERLMDAARLGRMKPGAVLVNTARGGLVDESALAGALESGHLGGAGLDVFVDEPLPAGHPFLKLDRVVLSPHVGGGSGGGNKGNVKDALDNIARWARGEPPHHLVSAA